MRIFLKEAHSAFVTVAMTSIVFFIVACENNSGVDSNNDGGNSSGAALSITPSSVELDPDTGHTTFTVNEGEAPFIWSVSDAALGTVSATNTTSRTVTYTPVSGKSGVNTVGVTDSQGWIASASIIQGDKLTVTLSDTTISTNASQTVSATVDGGTAPYSWSVSDGTLGSISSASGNTAIYASTKGEAGTNLIRVEDQYGWLGYAEVTQQ